MRAMAVDDKSVYLDQTDEKYGPLFREDRIGMMVTGPWEIYDTVKAGIDYGVVQLPGTDGNHTTVSGPDLWVMYDHQDADRAYWSYELIKWMTQNDQDAQFNLALGNLPLRSTAVDTPAFEKFQSDYPGAEVFVANQENATIPRPTVAGLRRTLHRGGPQRRRGAARGDVGAGRPERGRQEGRQRAEGRSFVTAGSQTEAEIASQPAIWRLRGRPGCRTRDQGGTGGAGGAGARHRLRHLRPRRTVVRRAPRAGRARADRLRLRQPAARAGARRTTESSRSAARAPRPRSSTRSTTCPSTWRRVVVTGVTDSPVAALADDLVDLGFADETSVVQTRFPTATLVAVRVGTGELDAAGDLCSDRPGRGRPRHRVAGGARPRSTTSSTSAPAGRWASLTRRR